MGLLLPVELEVKEWFFVLVDLPQVPGQSELVDLLLF